MPKTEKNPAFLLGFRIVVEGWGFEPQIRYKRILAFQASALSHSAILPQIVCELVTQRGATLLILLALVKGHSQKKCLFRFVRLQINSLDQKQTKFHSFAALTLVAFLKLVDSSLEL